MMYAMLRRRFLVSSLGAAIAPSMLRAESPPQREVPWLADAQRAPSAIPAGIPRLSPLLVDDQGRPIHGLKGWKIQREAIRCWWLDFLGGPVFGSARRTGPGGSQQRGRNRHFVLELE